MFTPKMTVALRVLALLQRARHTERVPSPVEWPGEYLGRVHGLRDNTLRALYRRGVLGLRYLEDGPMWSLAPQTLAIIDAVRMSGVRASKRPWWGAGDYLPWAIRLDDSDVAALTGSPPKLSRIPPAHWRPVLRVDADLLEPGPTYACGCRRLADDVVLSCRRFVSAELAEARGIKEASAINRKFGAGSAEFLRTEKFEGEAP